MGRARGDGFRIENPHSLTSPSSSPRHKGANPVAPQSQRARATNLQQPPGVPSSGKAPESRRPAERVHRHRRHKDTGCRNPQVRKGIGSCVVVLGIPCLIAGLILTIVSASEGGGDGGEDSQKYPASFPVLGPVLLALAVLCFAVGVFLYNIAILQNLQDCLGLSGKDSFCRRRFPRLAAWLKPDPTIARNQTAISNLQTAPARSALRRMPNPDLVTTETEVKDSHGGCSQQHQQHHRHGNDVLNGLPPPAGGPRRKRGVTFSRGDSSDGGFVGLRLSSVSSEPDLVSVQSENGGAGSSSLNGHSPSSSLLSLRNFRIHPKNGVFWTEGSADPVDGGGEGAVGGGGADEGVFEEEKEVEAEEKRDESNVCDSMESLTESDAGQREDRVSLTDIDEEGV